MARGERKIVQRHGDRAAPRRLLAQQAPSPELMRRIEIGRRLVGQQPPAPASPTRARTAPGARSPADNSFIRRPAKPRASQRSSAASMARSSSAETGAKGARCGRRPERHQLPRQHRPMRIGLLRQIGQRAGQRARATMSPAAGPGCARPRPLGFISPSATRRSVVLPAPFGPTIPVTAPAREAGAHPVEHAARAIGRRHRFVNDRRAHASLRRRRISQKKNGAPSIAVTTPSRSWPSGATSLIATSATVHQHGAAERRGQDQPRRLIAVEPPQTHAAPPCRRS